MRDLRHRDQAQARARLRRRRKAALDNREWNRDTGLKRSLSRAAIYEHIFFGRNCMSTSLEESWITNELANKYPGVGVWGIWLYKSICTDDVWFTSTNSRTKFLSRQQILSLDKTVTIATLAFFESSLPLFTKFRPFRLHILISWY